MFTKSTIALTLTTLTTLALSAPSSLSFPHTLTKRWITCSPDFGYSNTANLQNAINTLNSSPSTGFSVDPTSYATVWCDPGNTVGIQIYNANQNDVLNTDQGTIAGIAQGVLDQCQGATGNSEATGGAGSSDDESWVVTVRVPLGLC
ncbi:hypothetical protein K491DRAFT_718889 [Lophiostoma macrostomum CBS 122681]|uniref:Ecp2 effector protein domain-containing protein n=1 Tax=Lophiostoma macrostomum CBS 122681 TaxID=1314788 RepID=A0A6A6SXI9_9PLEO|nr:hypothetical protein K491DRAFT_718889 [Lophiostoma macrostomum CBS 122681]